MKTCKIINELDEKYGKPVGDYGSRANQRQISIMGLGRKQKITQHHRIPQICGGGNERENLCYASPAEQKTLHKIIDEQSCRKKWLELNAEVRAQKEAKQKAEMAKECADCKEIYVNKRRHIYRIDFINGDLQKTEVKRGVETKITEIQKMENDDYNMGKAL
jgi:hypothetical protein